MGMDITRKMEQLVRVRRSHKRVNTCSMKELLVSVRRSHRHVNTRSMRELLAYLYVVAIYECIPAA